MFNIKSDKSKSHLPTIVVLAHQRDWHLRQVIESIRKQDDLDSLNVCFIVQDDFPKVHELVEELKINNKTIICTSYPKHKSPKACINSNVYFGLEFAFKNRKSPYTIVLEDDTVIALDALRFFREVLNQHELNQSFRGINAFSSLQRDYSVEEFNQNYIKGNFGLGWGWCINKDQFEELSRFWNGSEDEHWDALIEPYLRTGYVINPLRSRVLNIGLDGSGSHSSKSDELFLKMSLSFNSEEFECAEYSELESRQPKEFWRDDYLVISGKNRILVQLLYLIKWYQYHFTLLARKHIDFSLLRRTQTLNDKSVRLLIKLFWR
jgi:hypothetical protein